MSSEQVQGLQRLSRSHRGVFADWEAAGVGIDRAQLKHLASRGWVRHVRRGVWAVAGVEPNVWEPLVAAALTFRGEAALSHWAAAAVHGFDGTKIGTPELTVWSGSHRGIRDAVLYHRQAVPPAQTIERRGVRVTSPARTLIDLSPAVSPERLGALVDDGLVRRLWTPSDLAGLVDGPLVGRRGTAKLRSLLSTRTDVGNSHLEQRLLGFLDPLGPFVVQHQVVVGGRIYIVDVAWPPWRVAAEIDGRAYRTRSRTAFERETRKLNELGGAEWLVAHLSVGMTAEECREAVAVYLRQRNASIPYLWTPAVSLGL